MYIHRYIHNYIYIYIDPCVNQYTDEIYFVYINVRMRSASNIYVISTYPLPFFYSQT